MKSFNRGAEVQSGYKGVCRGVCVLDVDSSQADSRSSSEGYNLLCFYPVLIALIWSTLPFGGRAPLKACQNDKGHKEGKLGYYSTK